MTRTPEPVNDQQGGPPQNVYYVVRPDLVLLTMQWFRIQPGILEKGAKKLFDKARKIEEGKDTNRWGHHHHTIIELFCDYTQERGYVLPWKELVEDYRLYDGTEGVSTRTGNKPLSTTARKQIDGAVVADARRRRGYELSDLARESSLPIAFLKAIESREWQSVTQTTAESLINSLAITEHALTIDTDEQQHPAGLLEPTEIKNEPQIDSQIVHPTAELASRKNPGKVVIVAVLVALTALTSAVYLTQSKETETATAKENSTSVSPFDSSQWFATIELLDDIYIPDDLVQFWTNGTYVYLRQDGSIGFNTEKAERYVVLPHPENNWKSEDRSLTISFPGIHYEFDTIGSTAQTWSAVSDDRNFRMTLKRVE